MQTWHGMCASSHQLELLLDLTLGHDGGEEGVVAGERGHLPVIVWSRRRRVLLLLAGLHLWLDAAGMRRLQLQLGEAIRIRLLLLLLPWEARGPGLHLTELDWEQL